MQLPDINILSLTFHLQAQQSVVLPPFLGSTLRGALGTALKRVFCFVPPGECEKSPDSRSDSSRPGRCWFFEACPYQYLFESPNLIPKDENHPKLRGQREVPQPFVLIPPALKMNPHADIKKDRKGEVNFNEDYLSNHFSPGENLEFSIILIGKAVAFRAQIVAAVRLMAETGLGEMRVPFILAQALAHNSEGQTKEIFNHLNPMVVSHGTGAVSLSWLANLQAGIIQNRMIRHNALEIEFVSPTRIRIADKIDAALAFSDLLKKITERIEFLAFLHAAPAQKLDYRPFLIDAEKCLPVRNSIRQYKYEQYSNNQQTKTRRDMLIGKIEFCGDNLAQYLPILTVGEILHVGSNTSAGFGRFNLNC